MDLKVAEETSLMALKMSATLNAQLIKIMETSSKEEFEKMRHGIGFVMGYLYTDVMEPIWEMHPELRPESHEGSYKVPEDFYKGY